jgi:hypothetical protein
MAAQPEQTGLPELVALVYRADWTQLRLSGTVHARHDVALRNRMSQVQATGGPLPGLFGRWLRSAQPGQPQPGQPQPGQPQPGQPQPGQTQPGPDSQPDAVTRGRVLLANGGRYRLELAVPPPAIDGIFGPDQLWSAFGEQFPERIYQISRLTVAMPGRYRIDHLAGGQPTKPQTIACDGERLWKVYPNRVATGPAQPLYLDFGRLADQSCLLYGCELTAAGEVEVDGRRGFLVVADGVDGVDGKWPGDLFPMTDHVEVVMDAQLGIALRETSYFQGEPFHCIELRDVSAPGGSRRVPDRHTGRDPDGGDGPPLGSGHADAGEGGEARGRPRRGRRCGADRLAAETPSRARSAS